MEFSPLIKGTPDWNEKYNQDIGGLCAEMDAARSSGILNTYVHTKSGTAHTLTGEGAIMRFTATAGWAAGDTISVNGLGKNPVALEGTALPAGAFAQGTQVVAVVDGENLQFLTQSYAGQFDAISTQMSNKMNKTPPKELSLLLCEELVPHPRAKVCYSKSDNSLVIVHFSVAREDGEAFSRGVFPIAKLPYGFIPSERILGVVGHNILTPSLALIKSASEGANAGDIMVYLASDNARLVEGTLVFYTL